MPLIEDAAEALGASYKGRAAGTLGAVRGLLVQRQQDHDHLGRRGVRVAGRRRLPIASGISRRRPGEPTVHYEHTEVGFNYRLSNLLAAMGRAQLGEAARRCRRVAWRSTTSTGARWRTIAGISFMPIAPFGPGMRSDPAGSCTGGWNGWLTCVTFDDPSTRDAVQAALAAVDIESRPLWKPMHLQPVFAHAPARVDGTSEHLFTHGLCLPSGSVLTDAQVERVSRRGGSLQRSEPESSPASRGASAGDAASARGQGRRRWRVVVVGESWWSVEWSSSGGRRRRRWWWSSSGRRRWSVVVVDGSTGARPPLGTSGDVSIVGGWALPGTTLSEFPALSSGAERRSDGPHGGRPAGGAELPLFAGQREGRARVRVGPGDVERRGAASAANRGTDGGRARHADADGDGGGAAAVGPQHRWAAHRHRTRRQPSGGTGAGAGNRDEVRSTR